MHSALVVLRLRLPAIVVVLISLLASESYAQRVGDKVFPKTKDLHWRLMKDGKQVDVTPHSPPWVVRKIEGDRLFFDRRGRSGWVEREEVVAVEDAPIFFSDLIKQDPKNGWAFSNRARAWREKGELENAIKDFTEALRLDPANVAAYVNRGDAWRAKGDYNMALFDYTEAIRLDRKSASAHRNRGNVWYHKGEYDKAIADFTEAIRLDPSNAVTFNNRAIAQSKNGELDKAIADLTEAIRLDPGYAIAYVNRGAAWKRKGRFENALSDYSDAVRIEPSNAAFHNVLARFLATCPEEQCRDGRRAVESAQKACELTNWENAEYMDTLAAAYAESQDFENAVHWQTKAIELLSEKDKVSEKVKNTFAARLALYKDKKPYRGKD